MYINIYIYVSLYVKQNVFTFKSHGTHNNVYIINNASI